MRPVVCPSYLQIFVAHIHLSTIQRPLSKCCKMVPNLLQFSTQLHGITTIAVEMVEGNNGMPLAPKRRLPSAVCSSHMEPLLIH